MKKMDLMIKIR